MLGRVFQLILIQIQQFASVCMYVYIHYRGGAENAGVEKSRAGRRGGKCRSTAYIAYCDLRIEQIMLLC